MNCHNATNAVSDVHERLHGGVGDDIVHALPSGLCLAADVAHMHDPQLRDLYRRLMLERRRHHNHELCAVVTHLSVLLRVVWNPSVRVVDCRLEVCDAEEVVAERCGAYGVGAAVAVEGGAGGA